MVACFLLAADDTDQKVIRVAAVAKTAEVRVHWVDKRHGPPSFIKVSDPLQGGATRAFGYYDGSVAIQVPDEPSLLQAIPQLRVLGVAVRLGVPFASLIPGLGLCRAGR